MHCLAKRASQRSRATTIGRVAAEFCPDSVAFQPDLSLRLGHRSHPQSLFHAELIGPSLVQAAKGAEVSKTEFLFQHIFQSN